MTDILEFGINKASCFIQNSAFRNLGETILVYLIILPSVLLVFSCSSKHERSNAFRVGKLYDFAPLEQKIEGWIEKGYYAGASIIIVKDNEIILENYYGNHTATTEEYIASAGKWLASATIAAVVEEGKLSWSDRVEKWLPEFTDIKGKATLEQLFSHTSGFTDYQPVNNPRDDYQTLEESVSHIVQLPADTLPGAIFHYGGLSMQVGARMAEVATGKDWETLFQEKISDPLGMKDTHFVPVDSTAGHNPKIGGGARSILSDYIRFLNMIFNGGYANGKQILKQESIDKMQADHVKGAWVNSDEFVERARSVKHSGIYGLGLWRELIDEEGEPVLISSPSWAGAYPWIDKEYQVYGFFIAHVDVKRADKDGFSAFYASPVLPILTREVIAKGNVKETDKI